MSATTQSATGRRKTSVARVWLTEGTGQITVNGRPFEEYLPTLELQNTVLAPFQATVMINKFDVNAVVKGGGTHVNISGVVLAKHAPNKANALKFIEWMIGDKAQRMHADLTYEYPVRAGIPINKIIASYGPLKADTLTLSQVAQHRKAASALVDKVGFDN